MQGSGGVHGRGVEHAAPLVRLDAVVHERPALELVVVPAHQLRNIQLRLPHVRPQVLQAAHIPQLAIQPSTNKSIARKFRAT